MQSLRIHWNSEWFGSFNQLLGWKTIDYKDSDDFNQILKLSNADLVQVQSSSMEYCIGRCLNSVRDASNHQDVIDSLVKLIGWASKPIHHGLNSFELISDILISINVLNTTSFLKITY